MTEETRKEFEARIAKVLEAEKVKGFELGYSLGESDGMERALEVIQTELLFQKMLTDEQMMQFFALSEERLKELKEKINTTEWLLEHVRRM